MSDHASAEDLDLKRQLVQTQSELDTLRKDYIARIAGMIKAVAAVDRDRAALAQAAESIGVLTTHSAEELVACYRRTAARFRDAFPATFGQVTPQRPRLRATERFR